MRVTFHGVRGCIPAPGPATNRYGGNTPCVSVEGAGGLVVLDAGTGIIGLGQRLMSGPFGRGRGRLSLLFSHTHWDHIQGFPFFAPVYVAGNRIDIYGPADATTLLEGILEGQMNPHFSPVHSLQNLDATIAFHGVRRGEPFTAAGFDGLACALPHGRVCALAYRLREGAGGPSVVYAPDAGYASGEPTPEAIAHFRGADLLIHDCTYAPEDLAGREARGYASVAAAARAAARAGVARLAMFHYDQDYSDARVDRLAATCRALLDAEPGGENVHLVAAREGLVMDL